MAIKIMSISQKMMILHSDVSLPEGILTGNVCFSKVWKIPAVWIHFIHPAAQMGANSWVLKPLPKSFMLGPVGLELGD